MHTEAVVKYAGKYLNIFIHMMIMHWVAMGIKRRQKFCISYFL